MKRCHYNILKLEKSISVKNPDEHITLKILANQREIWNICSIVRLQKKV